MDEYLIVYTTAPGKSEASSLADSLVKSRLVACVNYFPVNSTYVWKGKLEHSREYLLACKTTLKRLKEVEAKIKAEHPYDCPEIVSVRIQGGSVDYLKWVSESTN